MYDNLYLHGFEDSEAVGAAAVAWGSGAEALRNGRARALRRAVCGSGWLRARGFLDVPGFWGVRGSGGVAGPLGEPCRCSATLSLRGWGWPSASPPVKEQKGSAEPQSSAGLPQRQQIKFPARLLASCCPPLALNAVPWCRLGL